MIGRKTQKAKQQLAKMHADKPRSFWETFLRLKRQNRSFWLQSQQLCFIINPIIVEGYQQVHLCLYIESGQP